MIKMIIIVAIFFAVYPMIGNGYEQFANDFNLNVVGDWIAGVIENLKG
jgi:type III secretory pathway component EscS|tara:strand:+ start:343 stop:486 length:144 start_codon:yes stop_codon:yes gene_type:complete